MESNEGMQIPAPAFTESIRSLIAPWKASNKGGGFLPCRVFFMTNRSLNPKPELTSRLMNTGPMYTSRLPEAGAKAACWDSMSPLNYQDPLFQGHGSPRTANTWAIESPRGLKAAEWPKLLPRTPHLQTEATTRGRKESESK